MDALRHVVSHIVVREKPLAWSMAVKSCFLRSPASLDAARLAVFFVDGFDFLVVLVVVAKLLVTIFDHVVKTSYVEAEGPPSCERIWST